MKLASIKQRITLPSSEYNGRMSHHSRMNALLSVNAVAIRPAAGYYFQSYSSGSAGT